MRSIARISPETTLIGCDMNLIPLRFSILLILAISILTSCYPDDDDLIPSYIHIEQIGLITNPGQGTASHKITDAWVYIDNRLIGAFELPATFPVLKSGSQQITIQAGIKINGIAATRSAYPFFKPIVTNQVLVPGEVTTITDTLVTYTDQTTFEWMEDFDSGAISIDTTSNSETRFFRISNPDLVFNYRDEPNAYSLMAIISGDTILFECATINAYNLPRTGMPVFLEMNYRNDHNLTVGLMMRHSGQTIQQPILVLNPSEEWNKIYINLTPTLAYFFDATDFRVFIGLLRSPDSDPATIYLDNLKLIY